MHIVLQMRVKYGLEYLDMRIRVSICSYASITLDAGMLRATFVSWDCFSPCTPL